MRFFTRWLIDYAAIVAVGQIVLAQYGLAWALVAMVATGLYGCWCFRDGLRSL